FLFFPSSHPRKNAHQDLLSSDLWSKRACILFYHYPNHYSKILRITGLQDSIKGTREIVAMSACPGERGSSPSWARTSQRRYYGRASLGDSEEHSRGDG